MLCTQFLMDSNKNHFFVTAEAAGMGTRTQTCDLFHGDHLVY